MHIVMCIPQQLAPTFLFIYHWISRYPVLNLTHFNMMFPTAFVSTALFAASYVSAAPMNIVSRADVFSGDGTTYSPSVGIGACGLLNADTEMVVALGHDLFDNWPLVPTLLYARTLLKHVF